MTIIPIQPSALKIEVAVYIAEEPLILFDRTFSTGLHDKILGLYSRHGLTPRLIPRHVEAHEEAGAIMVASGKAIFMGLEPS